MEYKYQCGGYEKGQWVCKGVFDTQQEALDLANYLNRHPNSEYYDWSRFPVITEPSKASNPRDRAAQEFICNDSECECKSRSECKGIWTSNKTSSELEPLEVPMPIYSEEEMTYEEDLVKKIAVVLSVGNEAQAVRLIEKYAQYRLEPFEELVNNWHQQQINYETLAEHYIEDQHNNRKFTYKAMATRDCWKELLTLINK